MASPALPSALVNFHSKWPHAKDAEVATKNTSAPGASAPLATLAWGGFSTLRMARYRPRGFIHSAGNTDSGPMIDPR